MHSLVVFGRCRGKDVAIAIISQDLDGVLAHRRRTAPDQNTIISSGRDVPDRFWPGEWQAKVRGDGMTNSDEVVGKRDCLLQSKAYRELYRDLA